MTRQELTEAAYEMAGGSLKSLSIDQIERLMTVTQHVTDLCLNERGRRGTLTFHQGAPVVPDANPTRP
jgi:hypothetical protein